MKEPAGYAGGENCRESQSQEHERHCWAHKLEMTARYYGGAGNNHGLERMTEEPTQTEVSAHDPDKKRMSTPETEQLHGTGLALQLQAADGEDLNSPGAQERPQRRQAHNAGLPSKAASYLVNLAKEPPWTTISILAVIIVVEITAETLGQRTKLVETLALSADRWYTVTTYWTVHADSPHAWRNILWWIFTSPFAEMTAGSRPYAQICVAVTVGLGALILIIKADALTGDRTAAGLSIIGWMATAAASAVLFANLTGKEKSFRLGLLSSYIFLALAATVGTTSWGPNPTELPVQMLGHMGGASAGFIMAASAMRKGKFKLAKQNKGKEYIALFTSFSLLFVSALLALALT